MTPEEKIKQVLANLRFQGLFSEERERIHNPKKNAEKYNLLVEAIKDCEEICNIFKGNFKVTDPDFPCSCHLISMEFPMNFSEEIILRETIKQQLVTVMLNADEVSFNTLKNGDFWIYIGFEDIYTE